MSGLKETFRKRYIYVAERTNKAETTQEEQSEKAELSGEFVERNTVEGAIKTDIDTRPE